LCVYVCVMGRAFSFNIAASRLVAPFPASVH
jgi:hypothetical protein